MEKLRMMLAGMIVAALVPAAGSANPLDSETLWAVGRLGNPALSPDGSQAVVPVTHYDAETGDSATRLWLIPTAGGEARPLTSDESGTPAWSPDGRFIAFAAKRGEDQAKQLYVIAADGGEARRLTNVPGDVTAIRWFPDSKRLAFVTRVWADLEGWDAQREKMSARDESKMTAMVWDRPPIRWWDHWIDDREAHIFTLPLGGGEPAAHRVDPQPQTGHAVVIGRANQRRAHPPQAGRLLATYDQMVHGTGCAKAV